MQKTLIVANWKMNPSTLKEAQKLYKAVQGSDKVEVVVCPPFGYLSALKGGVAIGAQDCFWEDPIGAYTGEVSASMLREAGCSYVILGHSERKKYLGETEDMVQKKMQAALAAGLKVVLCVDDNEQVPTEASNLIVVYEPEWAISTEGGEAADPKVVGAKIAEMRDTLKTVPILYGGSTTSKNIKEIIAAGAQGALVGSSSLDAAEFAALVKSAAEV
jgi:triosephosphate isomerase (TIM)